jgi:hypothetical protein
MTMTLMGLPEAAPLEPEPDAALLELAPEDELLELHAASPIAAAATAAP